MKKIIMITMLIMGISSVLGQQKDDFFTARKLWINGERLSFYGDSAYLIPELTAKANAFYIVNIPSDTVKVRVFKMPLPEEYLIVYPMHAFLYQGKTQSYIPVSAADEIARAQKELFHLQKRYGFSQAITRQKMPVIVIYDQLLKGKKLR